jgi:aromatic-L-amino-acid/L-tryptophan decarboxylase
VTGSRDTTHESVPAVPPTLRDAPLALAPEAFRRAGHALVDRLAEFLESLPRGSLTAADSPAELRSLLDAATPIPEEGTDAETLLRDTAEYLIGHSLFNGHPLFFGYITSSPAPIGMLGDLLAAALNANLGAWILAPAATEIEAQTIRWIAELIGYPRTAGGLFVSGGNMANMVGLFTARVAAADWDVRKLGVADPAARPLRVYASTETHTWLQKATAIAGTGTDSICWIPVDDEGRMDAAALKNALVADRSAGLAPLMVVGTAGTVSTGAVDPLYDIAQICRDTGVWFHVDGAYGALAAPVAGTPHDLGALHLADSLAVDPHKWLYAPLEAGCVLVRDRDALRTAFSYQPPYYQFGDEAVNYHEYGPQNSRGFRALKVWLALKQVGRSGYLRMIGDDIRLCARLHERIAAHPELEALTRSLSIATFRYVPEDLRPAPDSPAARAYVDELNRHLADRIQASGEAFVSNAVIGGRYALRACIVNFNTRAEHVDALPAIVANLGREVDRHLRPNWRGFDSLEGL